MTGAVCQAIEGQPTPVTCIAFLPTGQLLVSGAKGGTMRLWDITGSTVCHVITGHSQGVRSVALSPNGPLIASASLNGHVTLWSAERGKQLHISLDEGYLNSLSFSINGSYIETNMGQIPLPFPALTGFASRRHAACPDPHSPRRGRGDLPRTCRTKGRC